MSMIKRSTRTTQTVTQSSETVETTETTEAGVQSGSVLLQVIGIVLLALGAGVLVMFTPALTVPIQIAVSVATLAAGVLSFVSRRR
ncbi:hypothetical protein J7E97_20695 [Streptomyces sp. ISL-66]|uniref:hypothetical protein n=1 Tax=Streptomyces sp. ISL-66 TaxID=2819186 RepID=UPI001BE532CF|nr:hypothetical protein [Streptomyces sp. ISL-66]MBT2470228.1 hypothetical protein [Streptomyces sp. ISL-66]